MQISKVTKRILKAIIKSCKSFLQHAKILELHTHLHFANLKQIPYPKRLHTDSFPHTKTPNKTNYIAFEVSSRRIYTAISVTCYKFLGRCKFFKQLRKAFTGSDVSWCVTTRLMTSALFPNTFQVALTLMLRFWHIWNIKLTQLPLIHRTRLTSLPLIYFIPSSETLHERPKKVIEGIKRTMAQQLTNSTGKCALFSSNICKIVEIAWTLHTELTSKAQQ